MKSAIAWIIDQSGKPERLKPGPVDLEKHLEDWVYADIDIVAEDVLVVGRQVPTLWGTVLDLLGIDAEGNLVIIELKRDQTLRETIAQGLEYAAWVSKQGYDELLSIAAKRFKDEESFRAAFAGKFKTELPASLNQLQRVLVVAPAIDDTTDTAIRYLADTYRIPINAVSFDIFGDPGDQVLVRHFVRDQSQVPVPPTAKKRPSRTMDELLALSEANGVRAIVEELLTLKHIFPQTTTYYLAFNLRSKTPVGGRTLAGISVYPTAETRAGAVELAVGAQNIADLLGVDLAAVTAFAEGLEVVAPRVPYNWEGWYKFALDQPGQSAEFCKRLRDLVAAGKVNPVG